jgi:hypothetical protein
MVEYRIRNVLNCTGFSFSPECDTIFLGLEDGILDDKELINNTSDLLTHEFLHALLYKEFGLTTCKLFDWVNNYFRLHFTTHLKYLRVYNKKHPKRTLKPHTNQTFNDFKNFYHITDCQIKTCVKITNSR